jgi:hypothetical protein
MSSGDCADDARLVAALVEKWAAAGDSQAAARDRFFVVLDGLFRQVRETNAFLAAEAPDGAAPVPDALLSIAFAFVSAMKSSDPARVLNPFWERGWPHADKIVANDVDAFTNIAGSLIPEAPPSITQKVCDLVSGGNVPKQTTEDMMAVCLALMKIACKERAFRGDPCDAPAIAAVARATGLAAVC